MAVILDLTLVLEVTFLIFAAMKRLGKKGRIKRGEKEGKGRSRGERVSRKGRGEGRGGEGRGRRGLEQG